MRFRSSGFTFVEMSVVIFIVVILITIAIPSFNAMITNTRMAGEVNNLLSTLNFARSEASKRGQQVAVCPATGGACVARVNWTAGWQVLQADTNTQLDISPGVGHGDTLTSTSSTYPVFTPMGYTFFSDTLSLHDPNNTPSLYRCIVFSAGSWTLHQGVSCP